MNIQDKPNPENAVTCLICNLAITPSWLESFRLIKECDTILHTHCTMNIKFIKYGFYCCKCNDSHEHNQFVLKKHTKKDMIYESFGEVLNRNVIQTCGFIGCTTTVSTQESDFCYRHKTEISKRKRICLEYERRNEMQRVKQARKEKERKMEEEEWKKEFEKKQKARRKEKNMRMMEAKRKKEELEDRKAQGYLFEQSDENLLKYKDQLYNIN